MADLRALKEGLDEGLLSEAEYAEQREKLMAVKRSDGGGSAASDMLMAVNALTDVAQALSHGVRSHHRREEACPIHPSPPMKAPPHNPSPCQPTPTPTPTSSTSASTSASPLLARWAGLKRSRVQVETIRGHVIEVDADALPRQKNAKTASWPFQCSKCPFGCKNLGAMTMHKKHKTQHQQRLLVLAVPWRCLSPMHVSRQTLLQHGCGCRDCPARDVLPNIPVPFS